MTSQRFKVVGQITMYALLIVTLFGLVWLGCGAVISESQRNYVSMSRILKGRNASQGEHPYLVSIQYLRETQNGELFYSPFCGGAILDRKTIVTAGHCFDTKPDCWVTDPTICYRIVAGEHDLTKDDKNTQVRVFAASLLSISVHENYDGFHFDNDIAMIHLDEPLLFNDHVKRIPLVKRSQAYSNAGVIAGWGTTLPEDSPSILQEANVTIYSDEHCENQWGDDFRKEGMICAGNKISNEGDGLVADACWGDSGGPLVTTDLTDSPRKHLIGIISWGYDCGYHEYPGLYTRIEAYLDWIHENRSRKNRRLMRWRKLRLLTQGNHKT